MHSLQIKSVCIFLFFRFVWILLLLYLSHIGQSNDKVNGTRNKMRPRNWVTVIYWYVCNLIIVSSTRRHNTLLYGYMKWGPNRNQTFSAGYHQQWGGGLGAFGPCWLRRHLPLITHGLVLDENADLWWLGCSLLTRRSTILHVK